MASFNGATFKVVADSDGNWPAPVRGDDGSVTYSAEIVVVGASNYETLQNSVTRGTVKPVAGLQLVNYHVEAGPGDKALVVPLHRLVAKTYANAVLTSFDAKGSGIAPSGGGIFYATAKWLILSPVTP